MQVIRDEIRGINMGKCIKCGKPAAEESDFCGFCKVSSSNKDKTKELINNNADLQSATVVIDNKKFSNYDDVKQIDKRLTKKKSKSGVPVYTDPALDKSKLAKSSFSKYDNVVVTTETKEGDYSSGVSFGGAGAIAGVSISVIVFLIMLTVFSQVSSSLNTSMMGATTQNLIGIIPLILVGAAIVGIITMTFRLAS